MYEVEGHDGIKILTWNKWNTDFGPITLQEFIDAAKTEFPNVPFSQLEVDTTGYDCELVELSMKEEYVNEKFGK